MSDNESDTQENEFGVLYRDIEIADDAARQILLEVIESPARYKKVIDDFAKAFEEKTLGESLLGMAVNLAQWAHANNFSASQVTAIFACLISRYSSALDKSDTSIQTDRMPN